MASYASYGSGNWYAWFHGANGDHQRQHCETREQAKKWAEHWRKTSAPADRVGVDQSEPLDLREMAALRDGM